MKKAVRVFLTDLIDYAGLFPPAKLPMEEAVRTYLHERETSPYQAMLGKFVCPTARLQEVLSGTNSALWDRPLPVNALGSPSTQASDLVEVIEADLKSIEAYCWALLGRTPPPPPIDPDDEENDALLPALCDLGGVHAYEFALPKDLPSDDFIQISQRLVESLKRTGLQAFIEVPLSARWESDIASVCQCISRTPTFGMKLRCGGLTPEAFPSDVQIASFIDCCRTHRVPWKATAGLHHPCRHWDASLQVWHHGFLNVFGAGILAWTNPLQVGDIAGILADRTAQHFRFEPDCFAWKDWSCSAGQVVLARDDFATAFGSCSFTEPCQDLIAMGMLGSP